MTWPVLRVSDKRPFSVAQTDELLAEVAEIWPKTRALKVAGFNGNQAMTSNVMAVGLILYKHILDLDRQRTEDY